MIIYKNHYTDFTGESKGYSYHEKKSEAREAAAETEANATVTTERIQVKVTSAGVLKALRIYASHPDNG